MLTYTKLIELDNNSGPNWNNLGVIQHQLANDIDAEKSIRTSIELDPKYSYAYYNLGCVLITINKSAEGIEMVNKAIKLDNSFIDRAKVDPALKDVLSKLNLES